jgi:hypothetical protein
MAYATLHKFSPVLKDTAETALPATEEPVADETDNQKKARARNLTAMCNFMLAFATETLLGMIFKSMTDEWPTGLAYLVIKKALNDKYRPKDTISRVELRSMLNRVSMSNKTHPSKLSEQL